jgi:hypothetical protein
MVMVPRHGEEKNSLVRILLIDCSYKKLTVKFMFFTVKSNLILFLINRF